MPDSREKGTVSSTTPARTLWLEMTRPARLRSNGGERPEMVFRSYVAWSSVCANPTQARNGDMAVEEPARPRI